MVNLYLDQNHGTEDVQETSQPIERPEINRIVSFLYLHTVISQIVSVLIDSVSVVIRGETPHRKINNKSDCTRDSKDNNVQ